MKVRCILLDVCDSIMASYLVEGRGLNDVWDQLPQLSNSVWYVSKARPTHDEPVEMVELLRDVDRRFIPQ